MAKDSDGGSKMGRPTKIDPEQLKALMRTYPTADDVAAFFKCKDVNTIHKYIKREFGVTFSTFREQNMVETRYALKRASIQKALKGDNTMLIWCTKNLCGWKDKLDHSVDESAPFKLAYELKPPKE